MTWFRGKLSQDYSRTYVRQVVDSFLGFQFNSERHLAFFELHDVTISLLVMVGKAVFTETRAEHIIIVIC